MLVLSLLGCREMTPAEATRAVKCAETYVKEIYPELRDVRVCLRKYEGCPNSCTLGSSNIFMDVDDAYDIGIYQAYKNGMETWGAGAVLLTWEAHLIAVTLHEFGHTYDYKVERRKDTTERTANIFMLKHVQQAVDYCRSAEPRELFVCDTCTKIVGPAEYRVGCVYEVINE